MARIGYTSDSEEKEGVTTGFSGSTVDGSQVLDEQFFNDSGADIPAGDWCVRSTTKFSKGYGRHIKASDFVDSALCVGIAMELISDGAWGRVRRRGIVSGIPEASGGDGIQPNIPVMPDGLPLFSSTGGVANGTPGNNKVGVAIEGTLSLRTVEVQT